MDNAITDVYPQARVITYADDCVVLHEDRQVLAHCQQLLMTWLAAIGLPFNEDKSHIQHILEGDQPGLDFLGFHIRQYRGGKHRSGRHASGHRLGFKTLIKPATANIQAHLAELGRLMQRSTALPQSTLICQLNSGIRGWASYDRTGVSQAVYGRLDHLVWGKLRRWAYRHHPMQSVAWAIKRYWHRRETRLAFATPTTDPDAVALRTHSELAITRHSKVRSNRSPYDSDWVYWSTRRGRHPSVSLRLATRYKRQHGRCASCGLCFHHDDCIEIDHTNGDRCNARASHL
jgi:RNA-directed DNA polymerase